MITIYDLNPHLLSQMCVMQKWDELWDYVLSVLDKIHGAKTVDASRLQVEQDYEDPEKRVFIQNFSKLLSEFILTILADPSTKVSDELFGKLIEHHESLHTLFYISGMSETSDVIAQKLLSQDGKIDLETQKKALILLPLDTKADIIFLLKKTLRKYHIALTMIYLGYTRMDTGVHENKIKLLNLGKGVDQLSPSKELFRYVGRAFFHVSYLYCPHKHEIRRNMNRYFENYLKKLVLNSREIREAKRIGEINRSKRASGKPLLLIYSEYFKKDHSVYRSWGRRIELLKEEFEVHLMITDDQYDESMQQDFENIHLCYLKRINEAINKIYEIAPDFLFFPTLGMTSPGKVFSNMRFCDIQAMGLGQPATTMSGKIDFIIGHEQFYDERAFPRDCFVCDKMPPVFTMRDAMKKFLKEEGACPDSCVEASKDVLEVTIVGTHFKLTGPFLQLVREMLDEAQFKVNLTFLISGVGLGHVFLSEYLKTLFPECTVKGFQGFTDYLRDLKETDLMLCPFPFGHSNTMFDALAFGKPCVSLYGSEPHNRTEAIILDTVELKDDFVCDDFDAYKQKFFDIGARILNGETVFFDAKEVIEKLTTPPSDYSYAQNFLWAYKNAQRIKAHHNGVFYPDED